MPYVKQTWADEDPNRPVSAARLNYIEAGIEANAGVEEVTPNTVPLRDAGGRVKVGDPASSNDAVSVASLENPSSPAVISARKTLSTKFQFNVLDYGAAGDGVTDDLVAINAAVAAWRDAATTSGSNRNPGQLIFPSGYRFAVSAPIVIKPATGTMTGGSIIGHGADLVGLTAMDYTLKIDSTDTTSYWRHWSLQGLTLRNGGLLISCSNDISNNLYAWNVSDVRVFCPSGALGHGIFVDNAYEGKISGVSISHINNTTFSGIVVMGNASSVEIIGGVVRRGRYGILSDGTDVDVFGTTLLNSDREGIRLLNARGNVLSGVHVERVQQERESLTGHQPGIYSEGAVTINGAYIYETTTSADRRMTHAASVYATASGTPNVIGIYSSNIPTTLRIHGNNGATAVVFGAQSYTLENVQVGVLRLGAGTTAGAVQAVNSHLSVVRQSTADAAITVKEAATATTRLQIDASGAMRWAGYDASPDTILSRPSANLLAMASGDSFRVPGTWDGGTLLLGTYYLWVDTSGRLRIKDGAPTSETDGAVVGAQS